MDDYRLGRVRMFPEPITPAPDLRDRIEKNASAAIRLCWMCRPCDFECPIHLAPGRLRPPKIVRMANFGMLDTLLYLKELWCCLSCRRCQQVCPTLVKPYEVIRYLRHKAIEQGIYTEKLIPHYLKLVAEFQRVRWRAAAACFKSDLECISDQQWNRWLKTLVKAPYYSVIKTNPKNTLDPLPGAYSNIKADKCFTRSECSGCCPVFCEQNVTHQKDSRSRNLKGGNMIVKVFIKRKVKQESTMDAFHLLTKLRRKAMNHPGYISGETLVSANGDGELMVVSIWQNMEDWISWKDSDERKTIDVQLEELQVDPTVYEPFVSSKYRLAAKTGFPGHLG